MFKTIKLMKRAAVKGWKTGWAQTMAEERAKWDREFRLELLVRGLEGSRTDYGRAVALEKFADAEGIKRILPVPTTPPIVEDQPQLMFHKLKVLHGFLGNGSDATVKTWQTAWDHWTVQVNDKLYSGATLSEAIESAYEDF